jgi:YD repeat-containing protein
VAPENTQSQIGLNNALENRVQFINYDSKGNLLEVSKANGPSTAYQWGYKNQYPVAQVINASSNSFFYNGFEETEGNSSVDDSKTGRYSHLGSYNKTLTGLDNGNYYLSYWKKTGSAWLQVISTIAVSSGVYQINLNDQIDDIRFYPVNSQVTSYTYRPLVGVTSITDAKGLTTYYEYDSFQRLKSVKDQNGNILKQTDYHYKN